MCRQLQRGQPSLGLGVLCSHLCHSFFFPATRREMLGETPPLPHSPRVTLLNTLAEVCSRIPTCVILRSREKGGRTKPQIRLSRGRGLCSALRMQAPVPAFQRPSSSAHSSEAPLRLVHQETLPDQQQPSRGLGFAPLKKIDTFNSFR